MLYGSSFTDWMKRFPDQIKSHLNESCSYITSYHALEDPMWNFKSFGVVFPKQSDWKLSSSFKRYSCYKNVIFSKVNHLVITVFPSRTTLTWYSNKHIVQRRNWVQGKFSNKRPKEYLRKHLETWKRAQRTLILLFWQNVFTCGIGVWLGHEPTPRRGSHNLR